MATELETKSKSESERERLKDTHAQREEEKDKEGKQRVADGEMEPVGKEKGKTPERQAGGPRHTVRISGMARDKRRVKERDDTARPRVRRRGREKTKLVIVADVSGERASDGETCALRPLGPHRSLIVRDASDWMGRTRGLAWRATEVGAARELPVGFLVHGANASCRRTSCRSKEREDSSGSRACSSWRVVRWARRSILPTDPSVNEWPVPIGSKASLWSRRER